MSDLLACITQVTKQMWQAMDQQDAAREAWLMEELQCYIAQYQREVTWQTKAY